MMDEMWNDQQAEADTVSHRYLTFWADGQLFGLPIEDVVQITGMQPFTRLPEAPDYVKGLVSLRDDLFPVIDVRLRLKRPEKEYNDRTCIIITKIIDSFFGFIVDEVDEVCNIPEEQITAPLHIDLEAVNPYLTGIAKVKAQQSKEKIIMLMNIKKLLSEKELSQMAQAVQ